MARSYESNGPDVKIRGTALHVAEKYVQLARDAQSSGDRVAAENYLQHAEHYFRIVAAAQAQMPQPHQPMRSVGDDGDDDDARNPEAERLSGQQPSFGLSDPQPHVNGNGRADGEDAGGFEERRSANREPRDQRETRDQGGQHRGRRRRPYRERDTGDPAGAEAPASWSEPAGEAASED